MQARGRIFIDVDINDVTKVIFKIFSLIYLFLQTFCLITILCIFSYIINESFNGLEDFPSASYIISHLYSLPHHIIQSILLIFLSLAFSRVKFCIFFSLISSLALHFSPVSLHYPLISVILDT